jgi:hypothetical protein
MSLPQASASTPSLSLRLLLVRAYWRSALLPPRWSTPSRKACCAPLAPRGTGEDVLCVFLINQKCTLESTLRYAYSSYVLGIGMMVRPEPVIRELLAA